MTTKSELNLGVHQFVTGKFEISQGREIPDIEDIPLALSGKEIELGMLFIDIRESTKIVDSLRRTTAARMFKSFLWGVAKIAKLNNGELRSFNGDGLLMAFAGEFKCSNATKAAMQMSWFSQEMMKPRFDSLFKNNQELKDKEIEFDFGIGIDVGKVLVVRAGIRGENNNDLVWIGNPTNYAVKLSELSKDGYHIYVSKQFYEEINDSRKFSGNPPRNMWEERTWTAMDRLTIYRTNWTWPIE